MRLEIHHIGIAGGDATAIVVKDDQNQITHKVLIDAGGELGQTSFNPLTSYLSSKLELTENKPFDLIVTSHYHADHYSGFANCNIPFKEFMDYGGYEIAGQKYTPYNPLPTERFNGGPKGEFDYYISYVNYYVKEKNAKRLQIPFIDQQNYDQGLLKGEKKSPVIYRLDNQDEITLNCYAANGILANGTNALFNSTKARLELQYNYTGNERLKEDVTKAIQKVSPNDHSLAFILKFGNFTYLTAGDLSGDLTLTRYRNIEEPLIQYLSKDLKLLEQGVSVLKANHHGSNWNNYPSVTKSDGKFSEGDAEGETTEDRTEETQDLKKVESKNKKGYLDELNPTTIIVPCNQMKGVPGGQFLARSLDFCKKSQDGSIFFINQCKFQKGDNGFTSSDNKEQKIDKNKFNEQVFSFVNAKNKSQNFISNLSCVDENSSIVESINIVENINNINTEIQQRETRQLVSIVIYIPKIEDTTQMGFKSTRCVQKSDHTLVLVYDSMPEKKASPLKINCFQDLVKKISNICDDSRKKTNNQMRKRNAYAQDFTTPGISQELRSECLEMCEKLGDFLQQNNSPKIEKISQNLPIFTSNNIINTQEATKNLKNLFEQAFPEKMFLSKEVTGMIFYIYKFNQDQNFSRNQLITLLSILDKVNNEQINLIGEEDKEEDKKGGKKGDKRKRKSVESPNKRNKFN